MKRFTLLFSVSCSLLVALASPASAAIEASAYLYISNFKIIDNATGLPIVASFGGGPPAPGSKINIAISGDISSLSAELNGLTGTSFANNLNPSAAYSNGTTTTVPAGFEDVFVSPVPAASLPYARADALGTGSSVTPLAGPVTSGANVQSISDLVVPNTAGIENTGISATSLTNTTLFFTLPTGTTNVHYEFDALVEIVLSGMAPPEGLLLSGSTSFAVQLSGTGINGNTSGSSTVSYAPTELNTGDISLITPGTGGYTYSGKFISPTISIQNATGTYQFGITQGTTASIAAAVPEPMSLLSWGVLASAASAMGLKRRFFAAA